MNAFMRMDPGLDRRFPQRLDLDDYSALELAEIAKRTAETKFNKVFAPGVREALAARMEHAHRKEMTEQNGGLAINLVEKAIDRQLQRIMASDADVGSRLSAAAAAEAARTLVAEDFEAEEKREHGKDRDEKVELAAEVDRLVGMHSVKAYLHELADVVAYVERGTHDFLALSPTVWLLALPSRPCVHKKRVLFT